MKNEIDPTARVAENVRFEAPVRLEDSTRVERRVEIGRFSYLSEGSAVFARTRIGRYCSIGRYCDIGALAHPTDYLSTHPFQYSPFHFPQRAYRKRELVEFDRGEGPVIGHDVWIGTRATILRGLTIGHGAVIAAGAVVTRDVAPYEVVGGLPAKRIRMRFDAETVERLLAVAWWDLPFEALDGLPFDDLPRCLDRLEAIRAEQG
ncbi:CatB-related O-acetyltransferase [Litorisediminicola beolgyonensis]|uniref:CatB-related O-acetyltransferase n=1 Tax=Litorisediminicola beolgyonensis TaxID=1173614 RepID=A0ABW3ZJC4_9RHOB